MAKADIKLPPQDLEAETSVLGALMLDQNAIVKVADALSARDFYKPAHAKIYTALLELFEKGQPIDLLTVTNRLKDKKQLAEVGGAAYLSDVIASVPSSAHVEHYAKIVREKRVRRDLMSASSEISEGVFDKDDFEDLLDSVERRIFSISQISHTQRFVHIKEELANSFERIEKLHRGEGGAIRGVPTGFRGLDDILSGLQPSDLILLGARPSVGKTTFALDIARHAAMAGHSVGIFSIEMSREQVMDRLIAAQAQVPLWKLRTGRLNSDIDFALIQNALSELSNLQMYVDDATSPTILQIRGMARRLQMERGLGLVVIDYLQLIQPRAETNNIVQQVTEISRGLKSIARELNVPVLALSQLSRAITHRDEKRPRLSDLRESGSLEQDSDVVLFLYREDQNKLDLEPENQNVVDVMISKHRNGPLGNVKLKFDPEKVTFRDIDTRHAP